MTSAGELWWRGWYDGYIGFAPRRVRIHHIHYETGYIIGSRDRKAEERQTSENASLNDRD